MRINYKGNNVSIIIAVEDANEILGEVDFYKKIEDHVPFTCTDISAKRISDIIKNSDLEVEVKLYKPKFGWSKVYGYFVKEFPNTVFLNIRKLNRPTSSLSNTIIHEYVHAIDNFHEGEDMQFGHNCGTLINTAPYEIGNLAEEIIERENQTPKGINIELGKIQIHRIIGL